MYLECSLNGNVLHSHTCRIKSNLLKNFTANFTAESDETESKQEDDFIEEWG